MSTLDAQFVELIDAVTPRPARFSTIVAHKIATEIRTAADALGTAAAVRGGQRHILAALLTCTYTQSRIWRYQLADCAWPKTPDGGAHPYPAAPARKWHCTSSSTTDTGQSRPDVAEDLFQDIAADQVTDFIGGPGSTPGPHAPARGPGMLGG